MILGPNGSGKSTLLRCLARTLPPRSGSVCLNGEDLYSLSARQVATRLAYVPQENPVGFEFTVRELAALGAAASPPLGRPAAERTERALAALDLERLAGRSLLSLSGGERQRAVLARALAQDPLCLLLDEPTAHLDLRHQVQLFTLLRQAAHGQGKAVLLVLHDLNLAATYADTVLLLQQGRIAASGDPGDVFTRERLRLVYQTDVYIEHAPGSGRPRILAPAPPEGAGLSAREPG